MNDWWSFVSTQAGVLVPLAVSAITVLSTVTVQVLRGFTAPNIGFYRRSHGLVTLFLIRNLSSVHYRKALTVRVTAKAGTLRSVIVEAGPWTPSKINSPEGPNGIAGSDGIEHIDITFNEVPSDGVFIIRAKVTGGIVRLEESDRSALKLKHGVLERPLRPFTPLRALWYFSGRWFIGFAVFFVLFVVSVWVGPDRMTIGGWALVAIGFVISFLGFVLVVSYRGKPTIAGFNSGAIGYVLLNTPKDNELGAAWNYKPTTPAPSPPNAAGLVALPVAEGAKALP
ncbi:MAG: hypothetical protein KIT31_29815 [Deltaproteobacteria bacterium]|nr:hypothetical protein [Deltaproteobacteria bacterium]